MSLKKRINDFLKVLVPSLVIIVVSIISLYLVMIPKVKEKVCNERKYLVETRVNNIVNLINYVAESDSDDFDYIVEVFNVLDNSIIDYIFVLDKKGNLLFHPYMKEYLGENILHLKSVKDRYIFSNIVEGALANEKGFIRYYWPRGDSKKSYEKVTYYRLVDDIIVCSGIYLVDLNEDIIFARRQVLVYLIIFSILIIIVSIIYYISKINLSKELESSKQIVQSNIRLIDKIFDNTYQLMGILDKNLKVVEVNQAALDFIQKDEKEVYGEFFWDTFWWKNNENAKGFLTNAKKEAIEKGIYRKTITQSNYNNIDFYFDFSLISVFDSSNNIDYFIAEGKNITPYKKAVQEVEELNTFLDSVLNSIDHSIIVVDSMFRISKFNKFTQHLFVKMFGSVNYDIINKSIVSFFSSFSDYEEQILAVIEGVMLFYSFKFEVLSYDNKKLIFDVQVMNLDTKDLKGAVVRIQDITDNIEKENKIIQAQKMDSIGNLAGGVAHDFNNILSGIIGTISFLEEELKDKELSSEEIKEFLDLMMISSDRAKNLVNQLLTISKRNKPEYNVFNLSKSIENVVSICENTFEKSVNITSVVENDALLVLGNQSQIEQVVLNLCINAYHAMTLMKGEKRILNSSVGGDLYVTLSKTKIDSNEYALVSIKDNGVGIDSDIANKIFEPFFTTKDKNSGTGLGLSVSYNIVQQHEGEMSYESEKGKGTTFYIKLPISDKRFLNSSRKDNQIYKGSGYILIIDDELIVRKISKSMLNKCGYRVDVISNGEDGISLINKNKYDLVIVDYSMPGASGVQVIKDIVEKEYNCKIIISSGFGSDDRILNIDNVDSILKKPYSLYEISKKVYEVLFNDANSSY